MPSQPEAPEERQGPTATSIVLRALLYALAITALGLFGPSQEHVFVYQGF